MDIFERIEKIDRRIIFLLVAIAVLLPLIFKVQMEIPISEPAKKAFISVDTLSPGTYILISVDYDPASMPELQPMYKTLLMQCFEKGLKPVMIVQWPLGLPLSISAMSEMASIYNEIARKEGKDTVVYGVDYCNIGYRPGGVAQIVGIGKEIRDYFESDYRGTPLDSLPMMNNIHNYDNFALLFALEAGSMGEIYVAYANARFGIKIIFGMTAVSAPDAYPYLQSGQIIGLLGGLQGAAEYETLMKKPGFATMGMTAQSWVHILIILFILLGNIGYFINRKKRRH